MKPKLKSRAALLKFSAETNLPTEFRIFKRGWNDSTKGSVLFDAEAAASVMAEYNTHGVDIAIDLEHLSLDEGSPAFDPDARGACKLAVRNGELWAVGVSWATDGARRLNEKTQRYISPAFTYDKKTKRVHQLFNIALCAIPATHGIAPLVAASTKFKPGDSFGVMTLSVNHYTKGGPVDPELLTALGLPEDATLEDVLAAIKVLQAAVTDDDANGNGSDDDQQNDDDGEADDDKKKEAMKAKARREAAAALSAAGNNAILVELKKLNKGFAALSTRVDGNERLDIIKANARKFTPALEKVARKWDLETLKSFVAAAPDAVEDDEEPEEDGTAARGAAALNKRKEPKLSEADMAMCKATGRNPTKLLEFKKRQAEKESA